MLNRAYSVLDIKSVDSEKRAFSGIATSITPDRVGDTIDPKGVRFKNPSPLLLYHDSHKPVGETRFGKATKDGVPFDSIISTVDRPGVVQDRINEAIDSLNAKPPLIKAVSIGFRPLEDPIFNKETGGFHFPEIEVLELSLVVIPANQDATITTLKSLDAPYLAASGQSETKQSAGVSAHRVVKTAHQGRDMKKSYADRIAEIEANILTKQSDIEAIQTKVTDESRTKDATERETFDQLRADIASLQEEVSDLKALDEINKGVAKPVNGDPEPAKKQATGTKFEVVEQTDKGIGFARAVMCKMASFMEFQKGNFKSASDFAKQRYPNDPRIQQYLQRESGIQQYIQQKASVAAGTTTDATWAAPLLAPASVLATEFLEFLRPETIVGKFGTTVNGVSIPPLRRVDFNVRIQAQSVGGSASWVGQGKGKPVTKFGYTDQTLLFTKIAAICVITEELARFSSPAAEMMVRDQLKDVVVERMDSDFIDPSISAISGVRPASITNGVTAMTSAGTSAANVLTDMQNLFEPFIVNKFKTSRLVLIMPETLAMVLSLQLNALGQRAFPDLEVLGGKLAGIPVITTQYAASQAQYGNMVIAVNTADIALADDGVVSVDASREASIEMSDAPANESATPTASAYMVSMFQTNSIALRAERFINWAKLRTSAVAYYDDVNWGSIGSPGR